MNSELQTPNSELKYFAGIDVGSVSIKAVVIAEGRVLASALLPSGGDYRENIRKVMDQALSQAGIGPRLEIDQLAGITATGVGVDSVSFEAQRVSEISCQARGCFHLFPSVRTVIDIGGQFTKAARLTAQGRVADFLISEKCATGSGRFLQVIARILQIRLEDIGPLSLQSQEPVEFSTNCAVFAESETVSRIAEGARKEDILAGVHRAMASKVAMLAKRIKMEPDLVLTGGGGADAGLVKAVEDVLGIAILVPEHPRLTAALGAALLAEENGN